MKALKDILKGMVIGIANIIPGVSGGTMMVAMGIYDKLIHCITHIFKEFKKSILFLVQKTGKQSKNLLMIQMSIMRSLTMKFQHFLII